MATPVRSAYIHETISLTAGGLTDYTTAFAACYRPLMERQGARLFGHWRANPFNSGWPEVTCIWEIDDARHFGGLSAARFGKGEIADTFAEWDRTLETLGAHGEGRLCHGNEGIRPIAQLAADGIAGAAVLQEVMTTKPGMQREYLHQLKRLFVPWIEANGNVWLGSFVSLTRNEEVIHYWGMQQGWEGFGRGLDTPEQQDRLRTWMATAPALRETWDDSHLAALPGNPLGY